jgi:hypothetical protein
MNVERKSAFDKLRDEHGAINGNGKLNGNGKDQPEQESWEEPGGDGRTSRHQVFGLQLIDEKKRTVFIPYSSIIWGEGVFNGKIFKFEFARGKELWEVVIEGDLELQQIVDKITAGKRESVRVNGDSVTGLAVAKK